MNKIKFLSFLSIGLLLVNIGLVAFLLFGRPGKPKPGGPRDMIVERLGFDEQQVAIFDESIKTHRRGIRKVDSSVLALKEELFSLLPQNTVPVSKRDSLIQEIVKMEQQKQYADFEHFLAIKKICKPEQLDEYSEFTKELSKLFGRKGRPGPPPHGR